MGPFEEIIGAELLAKGVSILLRMVAVLIFAKITLHFGIMIVDKFIAPVSGVSRIRMEEKKAKTINSLLKSILRYFIYFLTAMIILDTFNIQTAPIIASAGILGLAVGFGAQNLVKDVITGFFLIFEDQFSIGDYIDAAGVDGTVEEIGFRTTKIRDFGGQLHIVPNGSFDKVTNYAEGDMRVLVKVQVAYPENIDKVLDVLEKMCEVAAEEIEVVTTGPKVLGLQDLADSGVEILLWAKTQPMEQWGVTRQLRKRAYDAIKDAGIEIPFPHVVVIPRGEAKEIDLDIE